MTEKNDFNLEGMISAVKACMDVPCNGCSCITLDSVLKYLEERWPAKPRVRINDHGFKYTYCGKCGELLAAGFPGFCSMCGKPVLWDE
jgi:hypothetical protein